MTRLAGPDTANRWARRLFWSSALALAFVAGVWTAWTRAFPANVLFEGFKTGKSIAAAWRAEKPALGPVTFADVPPDSVEARRVRLSGGGDLQDPVVMVGGWWAFRERCPGADGCLAVEYAGRGRPRRAWPWLADELHAALSAPPLDPAMERTPGVAADDVARPFYVVPYANGDLLVTMRTVDHHFPAYLGVGRFGPDGRPRWFRRDASHHEAHVGAGDTVRVPGLTLEKSPFRVPGVGLWACPDPWITLDRVNVLDRSGRLVDSVSVLDAFLASERATVLRPANHCDPFHLNSVSMVGEDGLGPDDDMQPGDLVLSLRGLNAFAVLDRGSGALKRYVTGTFQMQHSVKHLRGAEFLVFDNVGGYDPEGRRRWYSRVLLVDAASGAETVVFPKEPESWRGWRTPLEGSLSISPDRTRVVASFSEAGKAVEVRISDGEALAEFDFLHDMRGLDRFPADSAVIRFSNGLAFYAR